ncbi:MAG TPA: hypothetical protein VKI65_19480, partial [Gemmataceae bacterium]|nr:hypothetical protein [Gemmataceae bacterium]
GNWPLYPRTLFELAYKHHLTLPGQFAVVSLPGSREQWEKYRVRPVASADRLPEPPERLLREFALRESADRDQAAVEALLADPVARERLKQEFFKKHPEVLERLRQAGGPKQSRKPKSNGGPD